MGIFYRQLLVSTNSVSIVAITTHGVLRLHESVPKQKIYSSKSSRGLFRLRMITTTVLLVKEVRFLPRIFVLFAILLVWSMRRHTPRWLIHKRYCGVSKCTRASFALTRHVA